MKRIFKIKENIVPLCFATEPNFVYVSKFNEEGLLKFIGDFNNSLKAKMPVIPVVVDSFGGEVNSLIGMVSIIKNCEVPVATIVNSKAMSCGAVLSSCGAKGYRFMSPYSHLLIHEVAADSWGKIEEIKSRTKWVERLNSQLMSILDKNSGKPKGFFKSEISRRKNADWFIGPNEAKKLGLIDHIGTPELHIEVNQTISLKY